MERNRLGNFGRGHYREHSCEIILNLDQWFNLFFIFSSVSDFVQRSATICAIMIKGIVEIIQIKLF